MNFQSYFCNKFAGTASSRGHPLSMYAKFSEKLTFLPPWFAHVRVTHIGSDEFLWSNLKFVGNISQLAIACSKLTIEALEQGVKYVQS